MTTFQVITQVGDPQEQRFEELEVPAGICGSANVRDILRTATRL